MIELGKTQCLNIVKVTDFGVYLGTEEDKVLLPKKQVPDDVEVGDALTVFVYRDSSDRLIATTNKPKIQLGELKRLKVSQVTGIGAFLDWGLEKDLLMPYKEQTTHVSEGSEYLVALYIDKSGRLAATMRINKYLEKSETLVKDSVTGFVKGRKLHSLLTNCMCYCLPSSHEGLPIALLEAMSYGVKVIVSDIPANLEVGLDKEDYFPVGNVDELAKKLKEVISREPQHIEYDMAKYDWDKIAREVKDIYLSEK